MIGKMVKITSALCHWYMYLVRMGRGGDTQRLTDSFLQKENSTYIVFNFSIWPLDFFSFIMLLALFYCRRSEPLFLKPVCIIDWYFRENLDADQYWSFRCEQPPLPLF